MQKNILKLNYILIGINFIFWLLIFAYFSFFRFGSGYLVLKILLFFEPICFLLLLFGIFKKIKIIYIFGLIFLALNLILSVTDQMGLFDFISLALNLSALISLLFLKNHFNKK